VNDGARDQGIKDVLRVMRWHWLLIAVIALLFAGAALGFSLSQEERYRAEASLVFDNPALASDALGVPLASTDTPQARATEGAQRVTGPRVRAAVRRRLKSLDGVDVSARTETETNYVVVEVHADSRRRALRALDAFIDATRVLAKRDFRAHVNRQIDALRLISRRSKNPLTPVALADQQARLVALRNLGSPVRVVRPAKAPAERVEPQPVRNTVLALVVGLVLGIVAAFARASSDRLLRTSDSVAESTALPVLARMRHGTAKRFSLRTASDGSAASELAIEAGRILRTQLEFLDIDRPASVVLVTSSTTSEGKSTVATALAVASALAGRRTLLLECDLRRPVLAERSGLEPVPGLSDLLVGDADVEDVLRAVEVSGSARVNGAMPARVSLHCVTAGTPSPQPAELLASRRFTERLADLSAAHDLTIIDSPPLLPVSDTLGLVPRADRVVLCARARYTTRDQVHAARDTLARLPSRPAGVVVTGVRRAEEGDYGYYQAYRASRPPVASSS
jgi:capsular exopolysaccharide synthesis family protein